jgi:hypothetical protein
MKECIVQQKIAFLSGLLLLSDEQYGARAHALEPVEGKSGVYNVVARVEFKAGEIIGVETIDKIQAKLLVTVDPDSENDLEAGSDEDTDEDLEAGSDEDTDEDLIDYAKELGIKNPEKLSREALEKAIIEAEK